MLRSFLSIAVLTGVFASTIPAARDALASTLYNAFATRFSTEDFGDITFVANSLMTCSTASGATGAANCPAARADTGSVAKTNNNYRMVFTDIDADSTTDNSSNAQLNLPTGARVLFAGLYWGGYGGDRSNPTNKAPRSVVKFAVPGTSSYTTLTATKLYSASTAMDAYQGFVDVTALMPVSANGTYTLANAQLYTGGSGTYGGWSMVVVYRDPNGILQNLTVFDGFAYVDNGVIAIPISGFLTPQAGSVNAEIGTISYDGDKTAVDSGVVFNGATLSNTVNPATDGFNSTISTDGVIVTSRSDPYTNTFGFDADLFNADGILANNQTSTTVRLSSSSEVYYLGVVSSAIKIFKPVVPTATKTQTGDTAGIVEAGDLLTYSVVIANVGTTNTIQTIISDAIPAGTTFLPGSLLVTNGQSGTTGAYSDLTDSDRAEFTGSAVRFRVGSGSDGVSGGQLGFVAGNGVSNTTTFSNSAAIRFTVRVNNGLAAGQVISNRADFSFGSVSAPGTIYTGTGNTVSATMASANLAISKTATPTLLTAGQSVTYTVSIRNDGPQTSKAVTVTDILPASVSFVSCASTGAGLCSGSGNSRTITFTQLASGTAQTITLVGMLASTTAAGTALANTATITAYTPDPSAANNTSTVTNSVQAVADLGIAKLASASEVIAGSPVTFTLVVSNSGPSAGANVVVTDILPANLSYFSCASSGAGVCGGSGATRTVSFATLAAGGQATITLVALATANGQITNTATIAARSIDPSAGNNGSTAYSDVLVPGIGTAKSAGTPLNNGDGSYDVPFTITVRNMGEVPLSAVQITDTLNTVFPPPAVVVVQSATIQADGGIANAAFTGQPGNDTMLAGANALAVGAAITVSFVTRVTPGVRLGPYQNSAAASGVDPTGRSTSDLSQDGSQPDPDGDGDPTNNNTSTPVTFSEDPRVGVAKRVTGIVNNGDGTYDVTYQLALENLGNIVVRNVQVTDSLTTTFAPPTIYIIIAEPSGAGLTGNATFNGATDTRLLAGTDSLAVGESRSVTFVARVTPGANLGPYNNAASVQAVSPAGRTVVDASVDGADPDPDANNNANDDTSSTPVSFSEAPAIGLSKQTALPVNNGDGSYTTVYTVVVKNIGNVVLTNVSAKDDLTGAFAGSDSYAVVNSASGGPLAVNPAFNGVGDTSLLQTGGSLAAGATTTVTFAVRVVPGGFPGPYYNQVLGTATSPASSSVSDLSDDASPPDPDGDGNASGPGENDATPVIFTANPRLGIAKSVAAPINNHDGTYSVTYIVTATNAGDVPLSGVQLRDLLSETFPAPAVINSVGLTVTGATANGGFDGTTDTALLAAGASLATGDSIVATITVRVTPGTALGPYSNSATGSAVSSVGGGSVNDTSTDGSNPDPDGDGDPSNNSDPTLLAFTEAPALSSSKRVTALTNNNDGSYTISYLVTVTNTGDVPLAGVQITDSLQSVFATATSWMIEPAPTASGVTVNPGFTGAANTNLLIGTDALAYGAVATVTFGVRFTQDASTSLIGNIAVASGSGPAGTPANSTSNVAQLVYPRLGLAKSVGSVTHLGGGTFRTTYVFTLTNTGTELLGAVQITDSLSATFGAVAYTVSALTANGASVNAGYDGATDVNLLTGGSSLAVVASAIVTLTVDFTPGTTTGPFENTALATATGAVSGTPEKDQSQNGALSDPDGDGSADNNSQPTQFSITLADVGVTKSAPPELVPGRQVVYTLTVTNDGPSIARDIVLSDPTPPGLSFVASSAPCAAFPCSISDLAVGAQIEIVAVYELAAAYTGVSPITNTVTISTTTNDPNLANDASQAAAPVVPSADLVIAKIANDAAIPGAATVFTVTVTNHGPSDAQSVVISDSTPAGLAWTGNTGACATAYPCAIGTLAAGATVTVVSHYDVPPGYIAPSPIANVAEVSSITADPSGPNTAVATVPAEPSADLVIAKTGAPFTVVGEDAVYTITVANLGPSDALNVSIADLGPADTQFFSNSGDCVTTYPCDLGTVYAGTTRTIVSTYNVPPDYVSVSGGNGPLVNIARVSSDTPDPVGPYTATAEIPLLQQADISITKTAPTTVTAGTNAVFTVTLRNTGPSMAFNAVVTDPTPSGLTFVSGGSLCPTFPCTIAQIDAGATVNLVNTYWVPSDYVGLDPIVNTATASSDTFDPSTPNIASANAPLAIQADLVVNKFAPSAAIPGTQAVFTVTVRNAGPSDARTVSISDPTPAGLDFVDNSGDCATAYPCAIGTLIAGQTITIVSTYAVPADYLSPDPLSNSATVSSTTPDPTGSSQVTVTVPVVPSADLAIAKTGADTLTAGQDSLFTVTLRNDGPSVARDVVISDSTPAGLIFVSNSGGCATAYPCVIGDLNPGQAITVVGTYHVPATYVSPDPVNNVATVSSSTADPSGPGTVTATVPLTMNADLIISKIAAGIATPGMNTVFTITVRNAGPSDARDVLVSDPTPAGLVFRGNTGDCATAFPCNMSTLAAGETITIVSTYAVPASYSAPDPISNSATVTSTTTDPSGPNAITATVTLTTSADLVINKTAPLIATPGTNAVFTVTVRNDGPSDARNVTVGDPTPTGLTFVGNSGDCATTYPCDIGTLPAGNMIVIVSTYAVPAGYVSPDPISNSASVTSTTADPTGANAITTTVPVAPSADLVVAKTGEPQLVAGTSTVFTITVRNDGPSVARNVVVSDATPSGLTFIGNSGDCGTAYPCNVGTVSVGQVLTIVSSYSVPAGYTAPNPASNTVWVSSSTPDPVGPNAVTVTVPLTTSANLIIAKYADSTITPGTNTVFTVSVRNEGPSDALNVVVSDTTPAGLTFVSNSGDCATAYPCAPGTLRAGGAITIVSTFAVPAGYASPNPITNTASVASSTSDPAGPDSASAFAPLNTQADLVISKFAATNATPGTDTTFTITVRNDGPSDARNVTISDPTPAGLTFVGNGGDCSTAYPCAIGTLAAGATITVVSTYAIPASHVSPSPISNSATVTSSTPDPNGANVVTATVPLTTSADLVINKVAAINATPGTSTVFTVTVRNDGPSDARNVTVSDPTPAGLTFIGNSGDCATAFPCALGVLGAGESITIVSTFHVPAGYRTPNPIANSAGVTSTTADPNTPNTAVATVPVIAQADVQLNKMGSADAVAGATTAFTITVYNAGPSVARSVTVSDQTPAGLLFVSNSGACNTAFPCALGDIGPGQLVTIVNTLAIPSGFTGVNAITNTAALSSTTFDPAGPVSVTAGVALTTTADLSIVKLGDPLAVPGTRTTFTITVHNDGPSDARETVVNDTLPAGLAFVGNSGGCSTNYPCSIGTLPAGATITIVSTYDVDADYTIVRGNALISNTATVASSTADPIWPNVAVAYTPASALADLELSKRLTGPAALLIGQNATYTLVLTNYGPSNASGVNISDMLPAGLVFVSASPSSGAYDALTGRWSIGGINAAQVATLTLVARAESLGAIVNVAQVETSDQLDPDATPGNSVPGEDDQSQAGITVTETPGILLSKQATAMSNGDGTYNVTYRFVISNAGNVPLNGLSVTDSLSATFVAPASFVLLGAPSASAGISANGAFDGVADTALLAAGNTLAVGASASVSFTVRVTPARTDQYSNSATASGRGPGGTPVSDISNDGAAPQPGNDQATVSTLSIADIQAVKTVSIARPNLGDVFTYVVRVNNFGPSAASNVVLTETLPAALGYVAHAVSQGNYVAGSGLWSIGTLANDASAALTLTVRLNATGAATNTVAASGSTPDPNAGNNTDRQVTPAQVSDLKISKRVSPVSAAIGQEITYTIIVTNSGPDAATAIVVHDELPAGVNYVRSSATQGGFDAATGDWTIDRLADRASAMLRIVARVTSNTVITNVAEIINMDQLDPNATPGNHAPGEDDQAQAGLVGLGIPVVGLSKQSSAQGAVRANELITYTLIATNIGSGAATNAVVSDPLPAGTTFVGATAGGSLSGGVVRWNLGTLAADSSTTVLLVVRVNTAAGALTIRNTAAISIDGLNGPVVVSSNDVQNVLAPTAIALERFAATPHGDGVKLFWVTALELDTLGFHIWRSTSTRSNAVRLTDVLIPAQGSNGGAYEHVDTDPAAGAYYWLEEIELGGGHKEYGPVTLATPVQRIDARTVLVGGVKLQLIEAPAVAGSLPNVPNINPFSVAPLSGAGGIPVAGQVSDTQLPVQPVNAPASGEQPQLLIPAQPVASDGEANRVLDSGTGTAQTEQQIASTADASAAQSPPANQTVVQASILATHTNNPPARPAIDSGRTFEWLFGLAVLSLLGLLGLGWMILKARRRNV